MRYRPLRLLTAAVSTTAILTLAACGGGDDEKGTTATPGAGSTLDVSSYTEPPAELPVTQPVSKPIPSGSTVAFIHSGVPVSVQTLDGFEAAAEVLGWKVRASTFDQTNPATIITSIESAIAEKPAAIVLSALQTAQYATVIPKAAEAGIPLIPYAQPDPGQEGVYPVANTAVRSTYAAKLLAETLVADAADDSGPAKIVQLTVSAFKSVLGFEDDGVKETLAKVCPDCSQELLDINLPDVFNGKYTQQVVSYLQRNPDVHYVVSDSKELADGLPAALNSAGLTGVKIYGFSPGEAQIKELQNGGAGAWVAQPYEVTGWIVADQVARVLAGDATDLWADEHLSYIITSENAEAADPEGPEFPEGYEDKFKALWNK